MKPPRPILINQKTINILCSVFFANIKKCAHVLTQTNIKLIIFHPKTILQVANVYNIYFITNKFRRSLSVK